MVLVDINQKNARTVVRKALRNGSADPLTGSSNNCHFARYAVCH
jgi:hypothetical protein